MKPKIKIYKEENFSKLTKACNHYFVIDLAPSKMAL